MEPSVGTRPRAEGFALIGLGAGARLVGFAAGAIAGLLTTAIAVRLLGTSSYGAFAFALSTAVIFGAIGRLGLEPTVARAGATLRGPRNLPQMQLVARGAFTLVALTAPHRCNGGARGDPARLAGPRPRDEARRRCLPGSRDLRIEHRGGRGGAGPRLRASGSDGALAAGPDPRATRRGRASRHIRRGKPALGRRGVRAGRRRRCGGLVVRDEVHARNGQRVRAEPSRHTRDADKAPSPLQSQGSPRS